jgi:hypothetical protein
MMTPEELARDRLAHPSLPWLSKLSAKRRRPGESSRPPPRAGIELLPKWLLCVPLVAQWLWLGIRHRSLTLPSAVNPAIENGGLAGESKFAYLERIGAEYSGWVARTHPVRPGEDASLARRAAGLSYPIVAKPDIGWCGYGVRRIDDEVQLAAYGAAFPKDASYLLQALIDTSGEAGLLYARRPGEAAGRLLGVALRHRPQVIGDGASTVRQLAGRDHRLAGRDILHEISVLVPAAGEVVVLTTVASLRTGGRYENGERLMSPALAARVDAIARSMGGFNFGRFDVKFVGEADLCAGDFQVIEINGAGSEAIQFWDPDFTMRQSFAGVFRKQCALFALGAAWRAQGHRPIGVLSLARSWLAQRRLIQRYPASN